MKIFLLELLALRVGLVTAFGASRDDKLPLVAFGIRIVNKLHVTRDVTLIRNILGDVTTERNL